MRKSSKTIIICHTVAAICFAIASYGHFYRGRMAFGWLFAVLTLAQLVLAVTNHQISRK